VLWRLARVQRGGSHSAAVLRLLFAEIVGMTPLFYRRSLGLLRSRSGRACMALVSTPGYRYRIEIGDHFRWKLQCRSREILAEVFDRRCTGNQQDVGRALKKPG
jgi:hypothetical protein